MAVFYIFGVPITLASISVDSEGNIEDWEVEVGAVSITSVISAYDFFHPSVVKELERQALEYVKTMGDEYP